MADGIARVIVDEDGNLLVLDADGQITSKLAGIDGHPFNAFHAGRISAQGTVTGTHALFTHDQQTQELLKSVAGSLRRIEEMLAEMTEVEVSDDPGEGEDSD